MQKPAYLEPDNPLFPDPAQALDDPDGLLAIGGNLQPQTLLDAYSHGIFPWYEQGQPLLWWSPSERAILVPGKAHISKSMAKQLRRAEFQFSTDQAFDQVIDACAGKRHKASGTWITPAMKKAYKAMYRLGHAHSVECWHNSVLVGGLYGLHVGGIFCGESMFSHTTNASKACFLVLSHALKAHHFSLIDCQLPNPHLLSLGVQTVERAFFLNQLAESSKKPCQWPDQSAFNSASAMLLHSHKQ